MELRGLMSYKTGFQLTKFVTISVIVISMMTVVVVFFIMNKKIMEVRDSVVVLDRSGAVIGTERLAASETRVFEYENHVRTFYSLWYAFDDGTFNSNIERALHLVGESGRDLLDVYVRQDVERNILERSLIFSVTIKDIRIDMSTNPVTGYIAGEQEIRRNRGSIKRNLVCSFILYDVDRTRENPHGCKVDNWRIINDQIINE